MCAREDHDKQAEACRKERQEQAEAVKGDLLGHFINKWRGRNVYIYQHKEKPDQVITVGEPIGGGQPIVCEEALSGYTATLSRIKDAEANGGTYIYE